MDWRHLLPPPAGASYRRLVVLGADEGDLRGLTGLAQEVTASADGLRGADAVVVTTRSAMPLEQLLLRLADDAVVYLEVERRRPGRRWLTPARASRMLGRAGFKASACWWVIPGFETARRHIPLDSPAALRWYLTALHTAGSPAARIADVLLRLLADAGYLAAAAPCYSMVAVGPASRPGTAGALVPPLTPVAMLTSGQDDGSRVVLLPFDNGPHPASVVKIARLQTFEGHTEREQQTLAALRARLPPELQESLPEPLGTRRWNGLLVASERYAPGAPLVVSTGRFGGAFATASGDLRCTVDWIIAFQRATREAGEVWTDERAQQACQRLGHCAAMLSSESPAWALLDGAAAVARRLTGRPLPIVPLHNDLGPWNIHRDGDRITVIDWELGNRRDDNRSGPGPCDLFYFASYWYLRMRHLRDPKAEAGGLRELFLEPRARRPAAAVHREILRYADTLMVDLRFLPMLLVLTWAERALERVDRAGAAGGSSAVPENRYLRYLEAISDRGTHWFADGHWP